MWPPLHSRNDGEHVVTASAFDIQLSGEQIEKEPLCELFIICSSKFESRAPPVRHDGIGKPMPACASMARERPTSAIHSLRWMHLKLSISTKKQRSFEVCTV